jgi:methionine-rich copper-binding protein CopC
MQPTYKQNKKDQERNPFMAKLSQLLALLFIIILLAACGQGSTLPPIPPDPDPGRNPTDTSAPTILMTKPSSNSTDIVINTSLSITFSEAMDENSVSFSLSPVAIMQAPSWNADKTRVTFVPQSALGTATTYTATTLGKDKDGNDLSGGNSFSFTTSNDADNTPPILVQSTPANNATDVAINSTIALVFNEPMTMHSVTLTLEPAVSFEATLWNDSRTLAVFTPSSALAANTTFTATVTGDDLAGNVLTGVSSFSFSTAAAADTTAPTVTGANPANNSTNVSRNTAIAITFSEAMNQASVEGASGISPSVSCSWSWNAASTIATCTPASLTANTQYNVTLGPSAEDNAGNNLASTYSLTFRTANAPDTTKPTVVSSGPANNVTNIGVSSNIVITFSEVMNKNATLAAIDVNGNLANYKVSDFGASWNSAGTILTLNPDTDFQNNEIIIVEIGTEAKDVAGNGLANIYSFSFTTLPASDTTAPTIIDTTPDSDQLGIKRDATITLFFSEAMNTAATGSAITVQGSTWSDGFDLGWGSDKKGVTLIPHSAFPHGENIVVTIGTGTKDEAGNALAQPYIFEFRVIRRTTTTLYPVQALSGQAVPGGYLVSDNGFAGEITNDSVRTMLTFDLSALPSDLTNITSAMLYLSQASVTGNPYGELGNLEAHHVNYGASLDANDFNTSTLTICNQNLCIPDPHSVVMTLNLGGRSATDTTKVQSDWNKRSERGNRSQYLIRFTQDRNEDGNLDQARFNLPQSYLSVTYEHP